MPCNSNRCYDHQPIESGYMMSLRSMRFPLHRTKRSLMPVPVRPKHLSHDCTPKLVPFLSTIEDRRLCRIIARSTKWPTGNNFCMVTKQKHQTSLSTFDHLYYCFHRFDTIRGWLKVVFLNFNIFLYIVPFIFISS